MNNTPNKLTPVIIGAAVMTILFATPVLGLINVLCCACILLGGFIGVQSYTKQLEKLNLPLIMKDAILIGLLSGIVSAIVNTGIFLAISLFAKTNPIAEMLEMASSAGQEIPQEAMQMFDGISNEYSKYGYSPTLTILTFVAYIILFPLFGMLGSFIAFQIYKKKNFQNPNFQNPNIPTV